MEPEKNDTKESLKNIIYNLIMERGLNEKQKKIIEKIVEEKKYS
ncbi:MAG: hypothetical protein PVJ67_06940 [Candidatus Pacearchaeota archaeon]|jgi:hypothetical protein